MLSVFVYLAANVPNNASCALGDSKFSVKHFTLMVVKNDIFKRCLAICVIHC